MKFFNATTFASTVLIFESLSIQSQAASTTQPLYSEMAYASSELCESSQDQDECTSTDLYDPHQSCHWIASEGCFLVEEEDICEHITDSEDTCNKSSGCAWADPESYGRPGEGHCVSNKIISEGNCAFNYEDKLYVVNSKDKCNDIKGCSWHKVAGGSKKCHVAPSQLTCEGFKDKTTCKKSGCGWKNKGKVCGGRWERAFLDFLVGKKADAATTALRVEYGESYVVRVEGPQAHVSERITLVVDTGGVIVEAPLFG